MIPVTDEQAKAIAETAKLGAVIVTEGSNLARCIGRVLGTAPENAVGLVIGDPLGFVRTAIAQTYDILLTKIFKLRRIEETQPVSPSVAIPLLRAAYDEGRPELQALWAELIAAAMDPRRSNAVRLSFIETLKQMDPPDALILRARCRSQSTFSPNTRDYLVTALGLSMDDVNISIDNLIGLGCFKCSSHSAVDPFVTSKGRLLMALCSPDLP